MGPKCMAWPFFGGGFDDVVGGGTGIGFVGIDVVGGCDPSFGGNVVITVKFSSCSRRAYTKKMNTILKIQVVQESFPYFHFLRSR